MHATQTKRSINSLRSLRMDIILLTALLACEFWLLLSFVDSRHLLWLLPIVVIAIVIGFITRTVAQQASEVFYHDLSIRARRIASRSAIAFDQLYAKYYSDSGLDKQAVQKLWLEVATTLALDPEKMRPEDRFDREYAAANRRMRLGDDLEDLELLVTLHCRHKGINPMDCKLDTLDDYIRAFAI